MAFREFALEEPEMFRLTFEQVSAEVLGHDRVAEAALDAYPGAACLGTPCARRRRGPPRPVRGELLLRLPQCEPGTGEINYPAIANALAAAGYVGVVGLEAWASGDSDDALAAFRSAFTP